ncbi:MAG: flagellar basal body-associated FliL family protein [Thermoleophilia bacterium]|nr:flagellar basal body-associated FliL family protein [Thermoleophilia bacterium]
MNTRVRYIIMVTVVAACAAVAGLYLAGVIGPSGTTAKKEAVAPIRLTDPFIVNLADTDEVHYVKLGLAVRVADMTPDDAKKFLGAASAEGGGEVTGAMTLAAYPPVRDAVIDTVSQFTAAQLNTADGKAQLKSELQKAFGQVATKDAHGTPDLKHDVTLAPYHIKDVMFTDFAVQ